MSKEDLSFIDTKDLVGELKSRFDGFVAISEKELPGNSEYDQSDYWLKGGIARCVGLLEQLKVKLLSLRTDKPLNQ
jgi:hypothetical protein